MKTINNLFVAAFLIFSTVLCSYADIITFDDFDDYYENGWYRPDIDGDGKRDLNFWAPHGTRMVWKGDAYGMPMSFIDGPGLSGSTFSTIFLDRNADLVVNFYNGARDSLSFGYTIFGDPDAGTYMEFSLLDFSGNTIASGFSHPDFTDIPGVGKSGFPEEEITVHFDGVASMAIFDFQASYWQGLHPINEYVIDNFEGNFTTIPEPGSFVLLCFGAISLLCFFRLKKRK